MIRMMNPQVGIAGSTSAMIEEAGVYTSGLSISGFAKLASNGLAIYVLAISDQSEYGMARKAARLAAPTLSLRRDEIHPCTNTISKRFSNNLSNRIVVLDRFTKFPVNVSREGTRQ